MRVTPELTSFVSQPSAAFNDAVKAALFSVDNLAYRIGSNYDAKQPLLTSRALTWTPDNSRKGVAAVFNAAAPSAPQTIPNQVTSARNAKPGPPPLPLPPRLPPNDLAKLPPLDNSLPEINAAEGLLNRIEDLALKARSEMQQMLYRAANIGDGFGRIDAALLLTKKATKLEKFAKERDLREFVDDDVIVRPVQGVAGGVQADAGFGEQAPTTGEQDPLLNVASFVQ
mmetsp:Transcript_20310/g.51306  ORF Transcript_20310/g.51306 Transcript_20310/m.51306 type:complete len:227 (-) Transcript_20310:522-1202(-)